MSRKGKTLVQCDLYCLNCGAKGLPVWRARNKLKSPGHRKAMYCHSCQQTVNHIELITPEQVEQFREDFSAGKYRQEAETSIIYIQEHRK